MRRTWPLAALAGLAVLVAAVPAGAAGTGDVELVPVSPGGERRTSLEVPSSSDTTRFSLVNLADEPRSARLYPAAASRGADGGTSIGAVGSAPWLRLADTRVELAAKEVRGFTLGVDEEAVPAGGLGAVVLEVQQGAVTVRVATLVKVEPRQSLPLPLWAVAAAGALIAVLVLGIWRARRRQREDEPEPEAPQLVPA